MQIIKFFDYIYYRTYNIYLIKWKSDIPEIYSICLITLLQAFNISTLYFSYLLLMESKNGYGKEFAIYLFFIILGLNLLRARKIFPKSEQKWKEENKTIKLKRGILIIIYICLSCASVLILAGILGANNIGN